MNFQKQNITNYNLYDTPVDNMFIGEYMATAPGDYVKVYLLALMYAELSVPSDHDSLARELGVPVEEVLLAWNHWEKLGLISKKYPDPDNKLRYTVEILNIREARFGRMPAASTGAKARVELADEELAQLYRDIEATTGRLFEGKEMQEIVSWMSDLGIAPDVILFAYKYCAQNRRTTRYRYVRAVLKNWTEQGLRSVADIEEHLEQTDARHFLHRRILKALGFSRNPTEEERRIMNTWFDELDYDIERVLEACRKTSGISNPNINYINSVLVAWKKEETGRGGDSSDSLYSQVMALYEKERAENDIRTKENLSTVFTRVPRVRNILSELREASYRMSKAMLMGINGEDAVRREQKTIDELQSEKELLLSENGFEPDITETVYTCKACRDTGTLESGERCPCFKEKAEQLLG